MNEESRVMNIASNNCPIIEVIDGRSVGRCFFYCADDIVHDTVTG